MNPNQLGHLVAVAILIGPNCGLAQDSRSLSEFRAAVAEAETAYANIECEYRWINYAPDGRIMKVDDIKKKMKGTFSVSETHPVSNSRGGKLSSPFVMGGNSRYYFFLSRKQESWLLTEVRPAYDSHDDLQSPFALPQTNDTYRSLFSRSDTHLISSSQVEWHGRTHTEWLLEANTFWGNRQPSRWRYALYAQPERPERICGVRTYDTGDNSHWLREIVLEYETGDKQWPALKSLDVFVTTKKADYVPWRGSRCELKAYRRLEAPPSEGDFTLSAFGLPEPKTVPQEQEFRSYGEYSLTPTPLARRSYLWLWIILALLLLAAIATVVYRRYRSRSQE